MSERFTRRARKAVRHDFIGTEHPLLGLVRESKGGAARVLSDLGVDPDGARREVLRRLGEAPEPDPLDLVESEIAGDRVPFRGRVEAIEVGARVEERHQALLVDLDYAYATQDTANPSGAVNHAELISRITTALDSQEFRTVEGGISKAVKHVLGRFPTAREITSSATRQPASADRAVPGVRRICAFRR